MFRRDFFSLIPAFVMSFFDRGQKRDPDKRSVSIVANKDDQFYIRIMYFECQPGNRDLQYFFLSLDSKSPNLEAYLSGKEPRLILGGYKYSKLKYISREYRSGKVTFNFKIDRDGPRQYDEFCMSIDKPHNLLSGDMVIYVTHYANMAIDHVYRMQV